MNEVEIIQIHRKATQGQTKPYIAKADDDKTYIVKGARTTYKGVVKEVIVAHLAQAFGLPIPPFSLAYVDDALKDNTIYELYSYNFASHFQTDIQDVSFSQLAKVDSGLLRKLYFFDYWIKNGDRCLTKLGGNPNFFIHQKTMQPYVLDHNLSFDTEFDIERHKEIHIGTSVWKGLDLVDRNIFEQMIATALQEWDTIVGQLPEEWLDFYDIKDINSEIYDVLLQFENNDFWEALK